MDCDVGDMYATRSETERVLRTAEGVASKHEARLREEILLYQTLASGNGAIFLVKKSGGGRKRPTLM